MKQKKRYLLIITIVFVCFLLFKNYINTDLKHEENKVVKIGVCTYKASDTFIASIFTELEKIIKE